MFLLSISINGVSPNGLYKQQQLSYTKKKIEKRGAKVGLILEQNNKYLRNSNSNLYKIVLSVIV